MSTTPHPNEPERLALTAEEVAKPHAVELEPLVVSDDGVAKLLSISTRHVWSLNSSGRLPRPLRFGRTVRWYVEELRAWIAAGAPSRDKWEIMKETSPPQSAGYQAYHQERPP